VFISHETRVFAWLYHAMELTNDDRLVANDRWIFVEHLREVFPDVMRGFYRKLAPNIRYWGDKNPHYADPFNHGTLELIADLFPGSRFIHIIRDGRDVVSSLMRKRSGEGKPWVSFEQAHHTWERHTRLGRDFGHSLPPNRYIELRYEDLVADDLAVAGRLFGFLGLEVDPAVVAFCESQRRERTPFKDPTRDLGRGIAASDWSTLFSPEEQARSLALIGPPLVRYGYETEDSLAQLREQTTMTLASQNDS